MARIEYKTKGPLSGSWSEMANHMREQIHTSARRALARNNDLRSEAMQRPGAEAYLPDLEEMRKQIEEIEKEC